MFSVYSFHNLILTNVHLTEERVAEIMNWLIGIEYEVKPEDISVTFDDIKGINTCTVYHHHC